MVQVEKKIRLRSRGAFLEGSYEFQRNRCLRKSIISLEQIFLLESRRFILSVNCLGQMSFLWIRQPTSSTLTDKISFCVSGGIYLQYVIRTCHDTKDNGGLYRFTYLFLKQSQKYSYIFVFHASYQCWNKNLKLCFSLADTAVKNR